MKKYSYIQFLLLGCVLMFLQTSCGGSGDGAVRGDGNIVKHEIAVEVYNEIKVEGAIDVVYQSKPDEAAFLEVEADDNIIPLIDIRVKRNTLEIKARESINPSRFIVYTNSPSLKYIESKGASKILLKGIISGDRLKVEMKGTGDVTAENLVFDQGEFKMQGTGDMHLAGQIVKAKYEISGAGDINASDLVVDNLECRLKGVGNMQVNVTDKISIEINGTGNVSYKGNPQITKQKIKGAGTVRVM